MEASHPRSASLFASLHCGRQEQFRLADRRALDDLQALADPLADALAATADSKSASLSAKIIFLFFFNFRNSYVNGVWRLGLSVWK